MHWMVCTPEYMTYYSVYSDEPPDYGADVVFVEADTKKQALVQGVRALRKINSGWLDDGYSNPFKGLKAEKSQCQHGVCWCELSECPDKECSECDRISEEEFNKLYPSET